MVPVEQETTGTQEETKPDVEVEEVIEDVPNSEVQPEVAMEEPANESDSEVEEKSSEASTKSKKLARYDGSGRIHTEAKIDQILDWYLLTGELPTYVSDRQRYSYRHHIRLPERKKFIDQQKKKNGRSTRVKSTGHSSDVVSLERERAKRQGSSA